MISYTRNNEVFTTLTFVLMRDYSFNTLFIAFTNDTLHDIDEFIRPFFLHIKHFKPQQQNSYISKLLHRPGFEIKFKSGAIFYFTKKVDQNF